MPVYAMKIGVEMPTFGYDAFGSFVENLRVPTTWVSLSDTCIRPRWHKSWPVPRIRRGRKAFMVEVAGTSKRGLLERRQQAPVESFLPPMTQAQCPYCAAADGGRCVPAGSGRFVTECRACGRVTEERLTEVEELFVERARESPLCIVTPDFIDNDKYRAPALEDDPYERIGFITAFSTWSLELTPLLAVTSSSFSGHLAELERVLSDFLYAPGGGGPGGGSGAPTPAGVSVNMVEALRAYYQIVDVTSVLGLERDSADHAVQLFRDCSSTTYLRNRNIEALATAALVQASREAQEPRTFQEISSAANIPQKEIGRHMKVLSDALKLSQPINSNSISVHMPRFCGILQLSKTTQDLATHIGEVVINKSFCTRRNPISISAAAIYLACQLEDKRKTQTEICKATGLTEVTLRKVYKELLENLNDLLPPDYTPAVPPEKAFPVSAAVLGRVCANRAAAVAHGEASSPTTAYMSGSNASSVLGATDSTNLGGSSLHLSSTGNHVRSATLPTPSIMCTTGAPSIRGPNPPSMDGRAPLHLFGMPPSSPAAGGMGVDSLDQARLMEATVKDLIEREKERERLAELDSANHYFKISSGAKHNLGTAVSSGSGSSIRAPFFPFPNIDPRLLEMWPIHPPYSLTGLQDSTAGRGFEKSRDDVTSQTGCALKGGPQFLSLVPGAGDPGNISALPPSVQLKIFQLANPRGADPASRGREQKQQQKHNVGSDRDSTMLEKEVERPSKVARLENDHAHVPATSSSGLSTFAAAAAVRSNFPWSLPTSFGDFASNLHSIIPQGGHQGVENFGAPRATAIREKISSLSGPVSADQLQERQHDLPVASVGSESGSGISVVNVNEASCPGSPSVSAHAMAPPSVKAGVDLQGLNVEVPPGTPEAAGEGNIVSELDGDSVKGSQELVSISSATVDASPAVVEKMAAISMETRVSESDAVAAFEGKLLSNGSGLVPAEIHDGNPLQHIGENSQVAPNIGSSLPVVTHFPGSPLKPDPSTSAGGACS